MSKRENIKKISNDINELKKKKNNIIDHLLLVLKSNGTKKKEIQLNLKIKKINILLKNKLKKKKKY